MKAAIISRVRRVESLLSDSDRCARQTLQTRVFTLDLSAHKLIENRVALHYKGKSTTEKS